MNRPIDSYRADLPIAQLIAELGRLFEKQRRTEQLICRYLADLADRIETEPATVMGGYVDIYHAARCCFGLSVRATRERVRVGRALRELPRIEQAFVDGQLSYSRVREVTRVATAETEGEWFEAATVLPMRVLERRVVEAGLHGGHPDPAVLAHLFHQFPHLGVTRGSHTKEFRLLGDPCGEPLFSQQMGRCNCVMPGGSHVAIG